MSASSASSESGSRYQYVSTLGVGGQGTTSLQIDTVTSGHVVVKEMPLRTDGKIPYGGITERTIGFLVKAVSPNGDCHPNLICPINFWKTSTHFYIVYPYEDGITLDKYMAKIVQLKLTPVQRGNLIYGLIRDICRALQFLHRHGIAHRDIKFDNIIVSHHQPKLIDLGMSCVFDKTRVDGMVSRNIVSPREGEIVRCSPGGARVGTPEWGAPELGFYTTGVTKHPFVSWIKSDLYSLGVLINWILIYRRDTVIPGSYKELVRRLRLPNPESRPDLDTVLSATESAIV